MAGTFLQRSRHGTVWYFRRRIPNDLRSIIGHPYIVKSLGTEQRREAVSLARALCVQTDTIFSRLRTMSEKKLTAQERLENFANDPNCKLLIKLAGAQLRLEEADRENKGLEHEVMEGLFRQEEQKRQRELQQEEHERQLERIVRAAGTAGSRAPIEKPFGMRFADAIEEYLFNCGASIRSRNTYRTRLLKAVEFFGVDTDIRYIEKSDLVRYAAHVKKTNHSFNGQKFLISQVLTLVNWVRDTRHWGAEISSKNLFPKRDKPESEERDAFTLDQMKAIFANAQQYKTKCPEKYWATLATAFLGCRINELAQINLDSDLLQHDSGFWYIKIAESDSQQTVKNFASWRTLPIHPALEKHGFVEFLLAQRAKGANRRPFETKWGAQILKDKENGDGSESERHHVWGSYVSSWGRNEMLKLRDKGVIVDSEKKLGYFHSMRHTFEGLMVEEKIEFVCGEAAAGHQYAGKDAERYRKLKRNPEALLHQAFLPGLVKLVALLEEKSFEAT